MAALSAADFFKQPTAGRPDRKMLVLKKYKGGDAFEMKDGTRVVFKYEKAVYDKIAGLKPGDNAGYNSIVFKDSKNKAYKLNTIAKNKEFGGGGGSGAGAENTKLNESSVCLWCAVQKAYGSSDLNSVVKYYKEKKVKDMYEVDETDKNMISQKDALWIAHYQRCAEFLIKGMFSKSEYIFHRGSPLVDAINKKFSELNKKMEVPFANINKWSPADIWASKKGFRLQLDKLKTLDDLNRYLLNELKDRNLVGISLKKTLNTIHQTNFNVGEKRPPMSFNGFRIKAEKKDSTIMSSKDVYVSGKGEDEIDMQVRSFDDLSGYQGELIGKVAKYGKIAHGPINLILKDLRLQPLPPQPEIVTRARAKDEKLIRELYKMFKKYADPGITEENFVTTVKSPATKADYLFSKYLGVKLIDTLMSTTPKNRNEFVQGALGYALSNTKNSAPFIKLS
jgi:hypothetical protein